MKSPAEMKLREFFLPGPGRYGAALILLLASVFLVMAFPKGSVPDAIALTVQMFALIACLRAAEAPLKLIRLLEVFVIVAVVVGVSPLVWGSELEKGIVRGATFVLVFTALPAIVIGILRQLKEEREITIRTVFGALCVYLLLVIAFASAFGVVATLEGGDFFVQGEATNQYGDFVYFAITTITTLGLGDLTPASDLGRSLTGMLTLIGQVYLVTVVALIVGNLGRRAPKRGGGKDEGDGP